MAANTTIYSAMQKSSELATLTPHRFVRIAGIVTVVSARHCSGISCDARDETGNSNVIVRDEVQQRYREALLSASVLLVKAWLNESNVTHVIAAN